VSAKSNFPSSSRALPVEPPFLQWAICAFSNTTSNFVRLQVFCFYASQAKNVFFAHSVIHPNVQHAQ
jgi:hypothetical protein